MCFVAINPVLQVSVLAGDLVDCSNGGIQDLSWDMSSRV